MCLRILYKNSHNIISLYHLKIWQYSIHCSPLQKTTTTIKNKQKQGKNANWDKKNYELQFDSVNIKKDPRVICNLFTNFNQIDRCKQ